MAQRQYLQQVDTGVWLVEGPVVSFYGFPYPTRTVIIRLPDGGLWVWSPVPLDHALVEQVAGLGPVRHLISPNKLHHLALPDWQAAFPGAGLWGPPSASAATCASSRHWATNRQRNGSTPSTRSGSAAPRCWTR